jgi:serine/threonine protein kinase
MGAITLAENHLVLCSDLMEEKRRLDLEIFDEETDDDIVTELKNTLSIRTIERDRAIQCAEKLYREHQTLCANFQLLREKYDDVKTELQNVLWNDIPTFQTRFSELGKPNNSVFETPTSVEHYRIGRLLGRGQFSDVKVATCSIMKKDYAVKVVKKQKISSMAALTRVLNELTYIKRLDHPNIVKFVDVIHSPTCLYLFLEIGGKDLFEFFEANPFGAEEPVAKQVMLGISNAIEYLHNQAHICHRDLKPENILLMEGVDVADIRHHHVRVCDFGHSASSQKGMEFSDLCGSPGFFAPEMILCCGSQYDGFAADIWSVGCIMLELIRGHDEFCTCWMSAYEYNILNDQSAFERSLKSALEVLQKQREVNTISNHGSISMEEFLLKLLVLEPSKRLTAAEILNCTWFRFQDDGPGNMSCIPSESEKDPSMTHISEPLHRNILRNSLSIGARKPYFDSDEKRTPSEMKYHRFRSKSVPFPLEATSKVLYPPIVPDTPSIKSVQKSVQECEELVRSIQFHAVSDESKCTYNG